MRVDKGREIVQPKFLPAAFKTYRGGVIDVSFEKIPGLRGQQGGSGLLFLCFGYRFCHLLIVVLMGEGTKS
jgi:hypothetical protein